MNTRTCTDCHGVVSSRATACPHCGAPMTPLANQCVRLSVIFAVAGVVTWVGFGVAVLAGGLFFAAVASLVAAIVASVSDR